MVKHLQLVVNTGFNIQKKIQKKKHIATENEHHSIGKVYNTLSNTKNSYLRILNSNGLHGNVRCNYIIVQLKCPSNVQPHAEVYGIYKHIL